MIGSDVYLQSIIIILAPSLVLEVLIRDPNHTTAAHYHTHSATWTKILRWSRLSITL